MFWEKGMGKILLLILIAFLTSCKQATPENTTSAIYGEEDVKETVKGYTGDHDIEGDEPYFKDDDQTVNPDGTIDNAAVKECVEYKFSKYDVQGKKITVQQKEATVDRTYVKKFINMVAPLAVYLQDETGMPSSVIISQWILETGWGKSKNLERANNISGHSCFSKGAEKAFRIPFYKKFTAECSKPRPEGDYYLVFDNVFESAMAYIYNLLYTSTYGDLKKTVSSAKSKGKVANWKTVVGGLKEYSANPNDYLRDLGRLITHHKLDRFDRENVCRYK